MTTPREMPTSRRLDPLGKRALFEAPVEAAPDTLRARREVDGKDALYSVGPPEPGTVLIECSGCRVRSRVGLGDAALRVAVFSLYLPMVRRQHPHLIKCPSCHQLRWCRIGWRA